MKRSNLQVALGKLRDGGGPLATCPCSALSCRAMNRRELLYGAAATAAAMTLPNFAFSFCAAADDLAPIWAEIAKRREETIARIQTWIRQPSIAAENRGMSEGCELTMQMFRDAGFQSVA